MSQPRVLSVCCPRERKRQGTVLDLRSSRDHQRTVGRGSREGRAWELDVRPRVPRLMAVPFLRGNGTFGSSIISSLPLETANAVEGGRQAGVPGK